MSTSTTIILIPARMASQRLPDKPLADIGGVSMIERVWRQAMRAECGRVVVACAEQPIADVIDAAGGEAIMTDPSLPSGTDRIVAALDQIDPQGHYDTVINLQGDLPFFPPELLSRVLAPLADPTIDMATLACASDDPDERQNPAIVKVVATGLHEGSSMGTALYFSRYPIPSGADRFFHHIGIYAFRRTSLARFASLPPSALEKSERLEQLRALEDGMRIGVACVESVPAGVDTEAELELARQMARKIDG